MDELIDIILKIAKACSGLAAGYGFIKIVKAQAAEDPKEKFEGMLIVAGSVVLLVIAAALPNAAKSWMSTSSTTTLSTSSSSSAFHHRG